MLYTCCNFQRNNCQRTCYFGGGNEVTNTTNTTTPTNNGYGCFTPMNGFFGVFIPLNNRRYCTNTVPTQTCTNTIPATTCTNTVTTQTTPTIGCGCRNLCTTGTTFQQPIDGEAYYARQYGLYTNCGCGF